MIPASRSKICFKPLPGDDPRQRCPDIALAKRELGWEPKTQLADGPGEDDRVFPAGGRLTRGREPAGSQGLVGAAEPRAREYAAGE